MATLSTAALIVGALGAVGGAIGADQSAQAGKRARKRGEERAKGAKAVSEGQVASQAREQRADAIRQSKEAPDVSALIAEAEKPAGSDSTFKTGPSGLGGQAGQMGRNKLLGQ